MCYLSIIRNFWHEDQLAKIEKGGGKLGRSETVTIRLDPKMNYLAELAARSQRRTKSSLIEAALTDAMNQIRVDVRPHANNPTTIAQIADQVWHVDEIERLRRLVHFAPHLMSYEEQKIWAVIEKNSTFWLGEWINYGNDYEHYVYSPVVNNLYLPAVEQHWDAIKLIAIGELPSQSIPDVRIRPCASQNAFANSLPTTSE
jgi:hypothetical protein